MSATEDFLKECMSDPALVQGPIPLDEFQQRVCLRCANSQCSRSWASSSEFLKRTSNWEKRLFTGVQRAKDDDPQYDNIRSKRFISSSQPAELWTPQPQAPPVFQAVSPVPEAAPAPIFNPPPPVQELVIAPPQTQSNTVPDNTPFVQGTVLKQEGEVVIMPGGDFTFNSDE